MAKQVLQIGTVPNDGTGDTLRVGADKVNDNFNEIYASLGNTTTLLTVVNNNLEIDVSGKANKISFLYETEGDLPNPATYHGSIAHVHETGALYYAHSGGWNKLVTDTSEALGGLVPNYEDPLANVAYQGILASLIDVDLITSPPVQNDVLKYDGTNWIPDQGGSAVGSLDDLTDVDLQTVDPEVGMVLKYDGAKWVAGIDATTGGAGTDAATLNGQLGSYYLNYNNFTNAPNIPTVISDLSNVSTNSPQDGQALVWNASGSTWQPGTVAGGSGGGSYDQDLNTTDDVEFNSVASPSFLTNGTGTPTIQSGTAIQITAPDGVTCNNALIINGLATIKSSTEVTVSHPVSSSDAVLAANLNFASIFTTGPSGPARDWTPNITNIATTNFRSTSVEFVMEQGATAFMPIGLQIEGSAQTILWQGGSAPNGTPNGVDVVSFTIIREFDTWTVLGSATSYS